MVLEDDSNKLETMIINHFPKETDQITSLCRCDRDFLEIITDYMFCVDQIEILSEVKNSRIRSRFEETRKALKNEIMAKLK